MRLSWRLSETRYKSTILNCISLRKHALLLLGDTDTKQTLRDQHIVVYAVDNIIMNVAMKDGPLK